MTRLEQAARGRPLSRDQQEEREALQRWVTGASRNRQRQQRERWSQKPQEGKAPTPAPGADRQQIPRPQRRA